jgi:hypothetical protein
MFTIVTGRYNNETWISSNEYRLKKNIACIYAPPVKISEKIDYNSPVFVIEMNNQLNEIIGIGLIKNKLVTDKAHKVHKDTNCNRYIYIGNHHISRELLNEYNEELVFVLEQILFKGYTHSKRGIGLTKIPETVLNSDICEDIDIKKEIKKIFIYHFKDKILKK